VPLGVEYQIAIIYAANRGLPRQVPGQEARRYERELYAHLDAKYKDVLDGPAQPEDQARQEGRPALL
jgi:F0F1-type ATP synthase alpha subunit